MHEGGGGGGGETDGAYVPKEACVCLEKKRRRERRERKGIVGFIGKKTHRPPAFATRMGPRLLLSRLLFTISSELGWGLFSLSR